MNNHVMTFWQFLKISHISFQQYSNMKTQERKQYITNYSKYIAICHGEYKEIVVL